MRRKNVCYLAFALAMFTGCISLATVSHAATIDFEDLSLPTVPFWHGPDPSGGTEAGPFFSTLQVGSFTSGGVTFENKYNLTFSSPGNEVWSGFAYSRRTNSTVGGFGSQHDARPGSGRGPGADNYGVGFGYVDLLQNDSQDFDFDPNNAAHLLKLPNFTIPVGYKIAGLYAANTTYGAVSMRDGDTYAKKFGGVSGNDQDWLKLTAYGTDGAGLPLGVSVDLYLADYRDNNNALDYVLDAWTAMDLTPLSAARRIYFNVSSSDVGQFGLNSPASYAIDDIELTAAVPEPATWGLFAMGLVSLGTLHALRRKRQE